MADRPGAVGVRPRDPVEVCTGPVDETEQERLERGRRRIAVACLLAVTVLVVTGVARLFVDTGTGLLLSAIALVVVVAAVVPVLVGRRTVGAVVPVPPDLAAGVVDDLRRVDELRREHRSLSLWRWQSRPSREAAALLWRWTTLEAGIRTCWLTADEAAGGSGRAASPPQAAARPGC